MSDKAINTDELGIFYEPGEINVVEWHPQLEGDGKPEQVHLVLTMAPGAHVMVRLKSRRAALELISALQEHADAVWPPT